MCVSHINEVMNPESVGEYVTKLKPVDKVVFQLKRVIFGL